MKLSVIIPTYNAKYCLLDLLKGVKNQTLQYHELIIIDSSSTDGTVDIAKKYTDKVIVIPKQEFDHGGTRTKAAKMAEGDILVYFTQDALPCDNYAIEKLVSAFQDEKVGAAYGRQLSYENTSLFGKHLRLFNYGSKSYIRDKSDIRRYGMKTAFLSNAFAAYRETALEAIGWFKEGLIFGEDAYAGAKLILNDYKIAYVAEAQVYHSHSYTVWQEFKRYFDIGVFHKSENWILKNLGKAEGEGIKYIQSGIKHLLSNRAWHLLPEFVLRNGAKYLGYRLGQKYEQLPEWLLEKCSMHGVKQKSK